MINLNDEDIMRSEKEIEVRLNDGWKIYETYQVDESSLVYALIKKEII